jgi:hypothetical protein
MVFSLKHDIKVTKKSHQNLLPTQSVIVVDLITMTSSKILPTRLTIILLVLDTSFKIKGVHFFSIFFFYGFIML